MTHAHLDHSAGVARLAQATRAPVFAFGAADSGRSPTMARLAATGLTGGEGVDAGFRPDIELRHGEELRSSDWTLQALHTPGHMGGHLSFRLGDAIFCGDLVMGWSTSLISPPEGDLVDYFRSLDLLARLAPRVLYPAHGEPITAPCPGWRNWPPTAACARPRSWPRWTPAPAPPPSWPPASTPSRRS